MTQEDKQLLLNDLCARLPYVTYYDLSYYGHKRRAVLQEFIAAKDPLESLVQVNTVVKPISYENIKPYLRPLSSMTEEEKEEFNKIHKVIAVALDTPHKENEVTLELSAISVFECDFYCSHHFDYRGLIEKGLALEAPEGMYEQVY